MLRWAAVFLAIAIIAGILGFGSLTSTAAGVAQVLFFIFIVIFIVALLVGMLQRQTPRN